MAHPAEAERRRCPIPAARATATPTHVRPVRPDGAYREAFERQRTVHKSRSGIRRGSGRIDLATVQAAMQAGDLGPAPTYAMRTPTLNDEGYFDEHGNDADWPPRVWRLAVGPTALRRRGLLPSE